MVQFDPITYTVTEGLDEFAVLQLIRSGVLTGSSVVTVTTQQGTASGMINEYNLLTKCFYFYSNMILFLICYDLYILQMDLILHQSQ